MLPDAKNGTKGMQLLFDLTNSFIKKAVKEKKHAKSEEYKKHSIPRNNPCPVAYKTSAKPSFFLERILVSSNTKNAKLPPKTPAKMEFVVAKLLHNNANIETIKNNK